MACGQSRLEAQARDERGIHCDDRAARSDRSRARIEQDAALAQWRTTRSGESKRTFPASPSASHSAISPVPLQTRPFCARPRRRLAVTALRPSARARGTRASTRERGRPEHDHNHHVRDEPRRRRARVARTPSSDRERVEPSARAASHGRQSGSERARRGALTSGTRFPHRCSRSARALGHAVADGAHGGQPRRLLRDQAPNEGRRGRLAPLAKAAEQQLPIGGLCLRRVVVDNQRGGSSARMPQSRIATRPAGSASDHGVRPRSSSSAASAGSARARSASAPAASPSAPVCGRPRWHRAAPRASPRASHRRNRSGARCR
jgi:hypothetical protein